MTREEEIKTVIADRLEHFGYQLCTLHKGRAGRVAALFNSKQHVCSDENRQFRVQICTWCRHVGAH